MQTQMTANKKPRRGEYALASGPAGVHRLFVLHNIYAPVGRRVLLQAGLKAGMNVADFGCGVGAVTRMLGEMVGPSGHVTGIDASAAQVEQASAHCKNAGLTNVSMQVADACDTRLPRHSFDLVYCRFLLLHLTDPAACLREMRDVLKPGGILVIEDGDLATATSIPPTALNAFANLFTRLAPTRGVDYSIANGLFHLVKEAGFWDPKIEIHQPAGVCGDSGRLLTWSVAEAGPAFVTAGLITQRDLESTIADMKAASEDPDVLVLAPRMSIVWARKAA
jgi:2-polyprenyl-3-methyl-5-hydroxy-6-metoxy-1,4-benzoquinol methylase